MKKIIIIIILLIIPLNVFALTYPELNSKKGIVYDLTDNKILYEKDSESISSIASLTKIMTTIVAIENIDDYDQVVTFTNEMKQLVRWDASVAGLKVGDKVTYEDLLYASILPSGADATIALALSTSGSIKNFTDKMNAKAKELGLNNTSFVNVTGLDEENHYSTAKDVLNLLKYALNNKLFKEIYTTKSYMLSNNLVVNSTIGMYSKNSIYDTKRILGSKTGFTLEAGYCISALINSNGHDILIILLNASKEGNVSNNILDTFKLINFIDGGYDNVVLVNKGDKLHTIKIVNSNKDTYDIKATEEFKYYLPIDYDEKLFEIKYTGLDFISYKNKVGEEIGNISYYYDGLLIKDQKVILDEKINFSIFKYIKNNIIKFIIFGIMLIVLIIISNRLFIKKRLGRKRKKYV